MKIKFDCVCYYVSELDRAIQFYTDVLGLQLRSRDVVARFDIDGILFELVPTSDRSKPGGNGNARLCLEVEDVAAAIAELQTKGVSTDTPEIKDNGVLGAFRDPDANEILVWQYTSSRQR